MLPDLFQLNLTNFYLQLSSEKDRIRILKCIQKYMKPNQRIFIGVVDPNNPNIETPEMVRDQVLEAAQFIPLNQLGTVDDCGYSPFADDTSTSREVCYKKIRARIEGTKLAEQILNKTTIGFDTGLLNIVL
jgi:5-methyltetrahydropteroyltriglutamate--homocysteine methyltransferase